MRDKLVALERQLEVMAAGPRAEQAPRELSELELMGHVRRGPGGRFEVVP